LRALPVLSLQPVRRDGWFPRVLFTWFQVSDGKDDFVVRWHEHKKLFACSAFLGWAEAYCPYNSLCKHAGVYADRRRKGAARHHRQYAGRASMLVDRAWTRARASSLHASPTAGPRFACADLYCWLPAGDVTTSYLFLKTPRHHIALFACAALAPWLPPLVETRGRRLPAILLWPSRRWVDFTYTMSVSVLRSVSQISLRPMLQRFYSSVTKIRR